MSDSRLRLWHLFGLTSLTALGAAATRYGPGTIVSFAAFCFACIAAIGVWYEPERVTDSPNQRLRRGALAWAILVVGGAILGWGFLYPGAL